MQAQLMNKRWDDTQGKYIIKYTYTSLGKRYTFYITKVEPDVTTLNGAEGGGSYSFTYSPWAQKTKIFSSTKEAYLYLSQATQWIPKSNNKMRIIKLPEEAWVLQVVTSEQSEQYVYYIKRDKAWIGGLREALIFTSKNRAYKTAARFGAKVVKVVIKQFKEI